MGEKQDPKTSAGATEAKHTNDQAEEVGAAVTEKKKLHQLGALEDDDEFEDFPVSEQTGNVLDALAKNANGVSGDHLWEDNWDDDDVEDDFMVQLRQAIQERAGAEDATMKD